MAFNYPYGNTQQLNLDWFLAQFNSLAEYVTQAHDDLQTVIDAAASAGTDAASAAADAASAAADAASAAADALKAEGYAIGEQDGTPVTSGSPYYHNNSKYYASSAGDSAYTASTAAGNCVLAESAVTAMGMNVEGMSYGTRNGTPVASDSPYYENNVKYWYDNFSGNPSAVLTEVNNLKNAIKNDAIWISDILSFSQGAIGSASGTNTSSTTRIRTNDYYYCPLGFSFTIPAGYKGYLYYYADAINTSFISSSGWINSGDVNVIPSLGNYARFVIAKSDDTTISPSDLSTPIGITLYVPTDKTLSLPNKAADAKAVGDIVRDSYQSNEMILYTDFDNLSGYYDNTGDINHVGDEGYLHTQLLRINPSEKYYFGWKNTGLTTTGAFFDINKQWIAPLLTSDLAVAPYQYPTGRPGSDLSKYVEIYSFNSPADAYYFAFNISVHASRYYRNYVSNKPVFALTGSGNYYVQKDDPVYQKYKNRKLCVIGPSTVSIDRAWHTGNNTGDGTTTTQHLIGWQEYLIPWWHTVDSYGYSGASWRKYDIVDGAEEDSIYTYVVTNQLDISGYDDYLLLSSGNGLTAGTIGTVTSAIDLGDVETYIGGLRQVIDYIYTLNPAATVYVQTYRYSGSNFVTSEARRALIINLNNEIRNMCELISSHLIDSAYDSGFIYYNFDLYSYDGGSHYNQIGSQVMGLSFRKAILGF